MVDILSYIEIELCALVLSLIIYVNIKGKKIQLFESLRFERIIIMNMILLKNHLNVIALRFQKL